MVKTMITNILCTIVVTLLTNVTERVPMHWVDSQPDYGVYAVDVWRTPNGNATLPQWGSRSGAMMPDADPQVRWTRTQILRRRTASLELPGMGSQSITTDETVSDVEVEYRLKRVDKWIPAATNDVAGLYISNGHYFVTNALIMPQMLLTNSLPLAGTNPPASGGL